MLATLGTLVVCVLAADFLTGLLHWAEDTYCLDGYPLIGRLICEPNIDHHLDPRQMLRGGVVRRNWLQWAAAAAVYALLLSCGCGSWPVALTLFVASWSNEVHAWNHAAAVGPLATFFREAGLIQSQRQHALHHRPPYTTHYCVLTSVVNAVLERMRFWRGLEAVIGATTGIRPQRERRRDAAAV